MADVTGGPVVTNASPFAVPADLTALKDHFGGLAQYSVTNAAALPAASNWLGRQLMAQDTGVVYRCTALPGTWVALETVPEAWISAGMTASGGKPTTKYRLINGLVQIYGVGVKAGAVFSMFTIPVGYRPPTQLSFTDNAGSNIIQIATTGVVSYSLNTAVEVNFNIQFLPA